MICFEGVGNFMLLLLFLGEGRGWWEMQSYISARAFLSEGVDGRTLGVRGKGDVTKSKKFLSDRWRTV
jgi:hypothetical protein